MYGLAQIHMSFAKGHQAMRMPTQRGDVLILETEKGVKIHAVGLVTMDGQQDFHAQMNVKYLKGHAAAMGEAKSWSSPDDGFSCAISIAATGLKCPIDALALQR
jgi:hypothetical protein